MTLHDVHLAAGVSQGAAPLGRELTITASEDNVIHELAGKPALEAIERVISELSPREQALISRGILIGIVIDMGKPEYEQGDFLVRGVIGADREWGPIAVGAHVHDGQVIRLHARDSRSAGEDLSRQLSVQRAAIGDRAAAGALLFTCTGRGRSLFSIEDHDTTLVERALHGAPTAGFFAAGEVGPVGTRSFLHTFTATVAVFAR